MFPNEPARKAFLRICRHDEREKIKTSITLLVTRHAVMKDCILSFKVASLDAFIIVDEDTYMFETGIGVCQKEPCSRNEGSIPIESARCLCSLLPLPGANILSNVFQIFKFNLCRDNCVESKRSFENSVLANGSKKK